MKNSCMQYHNMIPDNVNNCMNFNNTNIANNLCNQLLKDDNNVFQLNTLNRGMSLPTGIGPLANNGLMLPGARERNGNINILNSATQPFMDQNSSLFQGNRAMFKLPNYQNMDMNHTNAAVTAAALMNNTKPGFDKLYKSMPGISTAATNPNNNIFNFLTDNPTVPKGLKQQQSLPNNLFAFNTSLQKPMQQPNTFSATPSSFMNGCFRQPSSLLDTDFSVNVNNSHSTTTATGAPVAASTSNTTNKFNPATTNLNSVDSPFANDLYNNSFNLPLNYFAGNSDLLKSRTSLQDVVKDSSPIDDLKKVSPLTTSSTTPLFFSSINKTPGFMDLNSGSNVDIGKMDPTSDLNNKFYNLNLNMVMDKTAATSSGNGKDSEIFDNTSVKEDQKNPEKAKEDLEFSNNNDFINGGGANSILKSKFTFNLFNNNDNSGSLLDSFNNNDSFGLISKLSSSSMNLPFKKGHFDKMTSLAEKDIDHSVQSTEESSSTNTITNAKSSNSLNTASDFTLNEGNADNKTEPESNILSSLSNLTSEPIVPQVYSSSITTEGN